MSQLELAAQADVSQRHLSFIETGRSRPRADVVRRVVEALDIPLRDRNRLFEAAGLADAYPEHPIDDQVIAPFRSAIRRLLAAHEPYPAYVIDRWWDVVDANQAGRRLFPHDLALPNAVEAFLGPGPLREMVVNFEAVAWAYLRRLRSEVAEASDDRLLALVQRAEALLADVPPGEERDADRLVICPRLRIDGEIVDTITMVARFGGAREVTIDDLRVELIYPADAAAEAIFKRLAG
jgi:transcriptional regulator with XRE-family HTH domain